ncbi:MAG: PD40 domain-containing protein, partial [Leptospiraceae bacterium]|nr:PD40 domain-containing protein [Leptospiraceae bacterium]
MRAKEETGDSIRLEALPEPLNSAAAEFSPSFSQDGFTLYFNRKPPGSQYSDLYSSTLVDGEWQLPRPVQSLNSPYSDEAPFLSADEQVLFFASDRDGSLEMPANEQGQIRVSYDLYWSHKQNGSWSAPVKIPGFVNSIHHERSPAFDQQRQVLFFTRWPFGDFKKAVIMESRLVNGVFQKPTALPASINSGNQEAGFAPADNGRGYYFASRRPGGLGGWDVWFTGWKNGGYTKPVSMGPEINTAANDIFLTVRHLNVYF